MTEEKKATSGDTVAELRDSEVIKEANSYISPLPEVDFSTFIFSLNSSALVQLGVLRDPVSQKKSTNLVLAKHTIDTISMLKERTEGNLTSVESKMILDILYNLKMLYVKGQK